MTQSEPAALENAEAIIERFGGIRPMATKINVPVTTVQGWKKRNVIPGARRAEIIQAAQQFGVDLSDIMKALPSATAIANENAPKAESGLSFSRTLERGSASRNVEQGLDAAKTFSAAPDPDANLEKKLARTERRAVTKSTLINLFLLVLVVGSVVLLLWPQNEKRMASLESGLNGVREKQSFLSSLIPDNIESKINALQAQLGKLESGVNSAIGTAKTVSSDVLSADAGNLQERVARLEGGISEITGMPVSSGLSGLAARLQALSESAGGQAQLESAAGQLMALLSGVPEGDTAAVDQVLQTAPQDNPELAQAFEGVPPQDIKAAALLLGMTQFRSSLNRDNKPFAQDLALLKKLAGPEDAELQAAIDRLAPYAEQGVLTPSGLATEFRGVAGDVVVASLQGEDVSFKDKAQARLGEMFKVEKNGEPMVGTPEQKTLARADKLIQSGNLEGAIAQMKSLDGPAAAIAQPWVTKAEATVFAHQFKRMLTHSVGKKSSYTASPPSTMLRGLNIPGTSELIRNDETGINILRPDTGMTTRDPYKQQ